MMGLRWRLSLSILVFVLALVYTLPSVPVVGPALQGVLPKSKINLGLDLKGGIHLTLGVDVAKAVSNSLALARQDLLPHGPGRKNCGAAPPRGGRHFAGISLAQGGKRTRPA